MTNTEMLRSRIDISGYKIRYLAEKCGITYQSFLNRMNGEVEFRMDEARALKELLQLTDDEVTEIFFAKECD